MNFGKSIILLQVISADYLFNQPPYRAISKMLKAKLERKSGKNHKESENCCKSKEAKEYRKSGLSFSFSAFFLLFSLSRIKMIKTYSEIYLSCFFHPLN